MLDRGGRACCFFSGSSRRDMGSFFSLISTVNGSLTCMGKLHQTVEWREPPAAACIFCCPA